MADTLPKSRLPDSKPCAGGLRVNQVPSFPCSQRVNPKDRICFVCVSEECLDISTKMSCAYSDQAHEHARLFPLLSDSLLCANIRTVVITQN